MKRLSAVIPSALLLLLPWMPAAGQTTLVLNGGVNTASIVAQGSLANYLGLRIPGGEAKARTVTGVSVGLAVSQRLSDRWDLQLGAAYSTRGGRWDYFRFFITNLFWTADVQLKTSYLEFSALGRVQVLPVHHNVSLYVLAGPVLGLELSCRLTEVGQPPDLDDLPAYDVTTSCDEGSAPLGSHRSTRDVGLSLGAEAEIPISEDFGISVGTLRTWGIQNISTHDASSLKHRGMILQLGFFYRIFG